MTQRTEFDITQDILGLVGKNLNRKIYETLTDGEVEELIDYAGAVHFRASDNHNRVPPKPAKFDGLPDIDYGAAGLIE